MKHSSMKHLWTFLALAMVVSLAGCGQEPTPANLIRLSASVEVRPTLAKVIHLRERAYVRAGSYLELAYSFIPQEGFQPLERSLKVMAHLTTEDGAPVRIEDHLPPIPTDQWKAGQPVTYTDIIQVPEDTAVARLSLRVGLYDPADPATKYHLLDSEGEPARKPVVARLFVQREESLQYMEGWKNLEFETGTGRSWRWMGGTAKVLLRAPDRSGFLHIGGGTRLDCFPSPPTLGWTLGEQEGGSITMEEERLDLFLPLNHTLLGEGWIEVALAMDQTFVPRDCGSGDDSRLLGILVERMGFRGARFDEGWHAPESSAGQSWRWMADEARATLGLPEGDALLLISAKVPIEHLPARPNLEIQIGEKLLERFQPEQELVDRHYRLTRADLGDADHVTLILRTDQSYVPKEAGEGTDERRLGVRVDLLDAVAIPDS